MTDPLTLAQRLREYPRDKNGNIDRVTCLMWMGEAADRIETDAATITRLSAELAEARKDTARKCAEIARNYADAEEVSAIAGMAGSDGVGSPGWVKDALHSNGQEVADKIAAAIEAAFLASKEASHATE